MIGSFIRALRPWQWIKNGFVVVPLLFGSIPAQRYGENLFSFIEQHPNISFDHPKEINCENLLLILFALIAFCCWSSAVYVINDLIDRKQDRVHPRKCRRPIASGEIKPATAVCMAILLATLPFCSMAVATTLPRWDGQEIILSSRLFMLVGLAYLANGICYCLFFRSAVFLDVFSIAVGFVLRVVAGCFAIAVEPSPWILVCTFTLALFLAFGKRKMEWSVHNETAEFRPTLANYSASTLNVFMGVSATVCLVSYLFYTIDSNTIAHHGTRNLIYTVPFVFYGIFRYILATDSGLFDGPDEFLLRDHPFQINIVLWAMCSAFFLWL